MAGLEAVRDAIKATLEGAISGLQVYDTVPGATNVLPCVVVFPQDAEFGETMGRGTDVWFFELWVMVSDGELGTAQDQLDALVTGAGDRSIRQAIFKARTLGLSNTAAHITAMSSYGTTFTAASIDHIGAKLRLMVATRGTE
ncbi:hypothetical protein [Herbidospora daliensis]|uniref:hypothetical protein n=1 Tax=Herbidospora daliensis TaxID=295585 RepID=UPI00078423DE|nr:hypothetical protein [Herbidospora daliensis]